MTPAIFGRSTSSFASFSTRLATVRILSHSSSGTPCAFNSATVVETIVDSTSVGWTPGLNLYVEGKSQPSRLPLASGGSPIASVFAAAA